MIKNIFEKLISNKSPCPEDFVRYYSDVFSHNDSRSDSEETAGTTEPSDFRPISVSTTIATIYVSLLLGKKGFLKNTHLCQFGYKNNTFCKTAFLVANKTIHYNNEQSNFHVASLNAAKAYDKFWRNGLFY